jgi:hypothetical protein
VTNYVPTTWVDDVPPGTGTPLDAAHFNKLEGGAAAALPRSSVVSAGTFAYTNYLNAGDGSPAFGFRGDGMMFWGPGGAAGMDVYLLRSAAGTLKTDGTLVVTGILAFQDSA